MTRPVIFLDFDGPLIPERMIFTQKNLGNMPAEFDSAAVSLIERVAKDVNAEYVISSSWRSLGATTIPIVLQLNGFSLERVHKDWATPRRLSSSRSQEINMWLNDHPEVKIWAAIDDEPIHIAFPNNSVRVTLENGFLWEHYLLLRKILSADEKQ